MTYSYQYTTESSFTTSVEWHFFKLRAIPCNNEFQRVESHTLLVTPTCQFMQSTDGQGNRVQWGSISERHSLFRFESAGRVVQRQPYALHEAPAPYYLASTSLTSCTGTMHQIACQLHTKLLERRADANCFDVAQEVMHMVHYHIAYTPGHTTNATTAAEVYADPRGVCQDYAHLMIALCRSLGLYARYVNGLIEGEGSTHAWVEVSDGYVWHPFDPTHDTLPEWGYIKIAHGRDASDCPTARGTLYGCTQEQQSVWCKLETRNS